MREQNPVEERLAEQMCRLNRDGMSWELIGKRFCMSGVEARRIVREYKRRKEAR